MVASAVDDGLRDFFGAGSLEEAADAEREREPPLSSLETLPTNARDGGANESNVSNVSNQIFFRIFNSFSNRF